MYITNITSRFPNQCQTSSCMKPCYWCLYIQVHVVCCCGSFSDRTHTIGSMCYILFPPQSCFRFTNQISLSGKPRCTRCAQVHGLVTYLTSDSDVRGKKDQILQSLISMHVHQYVEHADPMDHTDMHMTFVSVKIMPKTLICYCNASLILKYTIQNHFLCVFQHFWL